MSQRGDLTHVRPLPSLLSSSEIRIGFCKQTGYVLTEYHSGQEPFSVSLTGNPAGYLQARYLLEIAEIGGRGLASSVGNFQAHSANALLPQIYEPRGGGRSKGKHLPVGKAFDEA